MKIKVKTLKGTQFKIKVKPQHTVADVKKNIETVQGPAVYPAEQQMLIHRGKILKDETTLEENKVVNNSFVAIMLSKSKRSASGSLITSAAPANVAQHASSVTSSTQPTPASLSPLTVAPSESATQSIQAPFTVPALSPAQSWAETNVFGQSASGLVTGSSLENNIQKLLVMGRGRWDRETVIRALHAAFNNPKKAVHYLFFGISEQAEVPPVAQAPAGGQAINSRVPTPQLAAPIGSLNASFLDLFPQGLPNLSSNSTADTLDILRNDPRLRAIRARLRADPQILQPMLQELEKQNPNLMRWIQEHQTDLLILLSEPVEAEREVLGQLPRTRLRLRESWSITPEQMDAVECSKGSASGSLITLAASANVGIPEQAEASPVAEAPAGGQAINSRAPAPQMAAPTGSLNANFHYLFPQGLPNLSSNATAGTLDFLKNDPQFRAIRARVQDNPQVLQPMLQELGKQNPNLMRWIQEHQTDFLNLINEPVEAESKLLGQLPRTRLRLRESWSITPEQMDAVERLADMGFNKWLAMEVYFMCDKNEEIAANYLLDHDLELEE